jgi:hypothetical protein
MTVPTCFGGEINTLIYLPHLCLFINILHEELLSTKYDIERIVKTNHMNIIRKGTSHSRKV